MSKKIANTTGENGIILGEFKKLFQKYAEIDVSLENLEIKKKKLEELRVKEEESFERDHFGKKIEICELLFGIVENLTNQEYYKQLCHILKKDRFSSVEPSLPCIHTLEKSYKSIESIYIMEHPELKGFRILYQYRGKVGGMGYYPLKKVAFENPAEMAKKLKFEFIQSISKEINTGSIIKSLKLQFKGLIMNKISDLERMQNINL